MKEFCFIYEKNLHNKFLNFKEILKNSYNKTIVQILNNNTQNMFVCAIDKECFELIKNSICEFVANIVLDNYKFEYLQKTIKNLNKLRIEEKILLTSLKNYDDEFEKQEIIKEINLNEDINVKSFIMFKLTNLFKKWNDLCKITDDNFEVLTNLNVLTSLIKFLLSKSLNKMQKVCVEFKKNNIVVCNINNKIKNFKFNDFLVYIINVNPKTIVVNGYQNLENKNNKIVKIFKSIFNKKIVKTI